MPLGSWDDMSDYVVHFTKLTEPQSDYNAIMRILATGSLQPNRGFGIGKGRAPAPQTQYAVCFSEIPAGQWARLEQRRGTKYGLGFRKEFILSKGGGPIWYAWKDTPHWLALQQLMKDAATDRNAVIWQLTPMIDAPGKYNGSQYEFDWEREWRHVGDMHFSPEDVAFLLIPEDLHSAAREFFRSAAIENTGPAYLCPFVDPAWDKQRVHAALNE